MNNNYQCRPRGGSAKGSAQNESKVMGASSQRGSTVEVLGEDEDDLCDHCTAGAKVDESKPGVENLSPMTGPRLVSTNLAEDNEVIESAIKLGITKFNFNMV